ncbi:MAG: sulfatase/phosphatase domain-containing protein [Fibrobacterota bacterium]
MLSLFSPISGAATASATSATLLSTRLILTGICAEGTVFTNAYSATPSRVPARTGLFTGLKQGNHGRVGYLHFARTKNRDNLDAIDDYLPWLRKQEMLGDHNLFRKNLPYEGSANVPLIIKGPKDSGIKRGALCDNPVELRDIMPTMLELAGQEIPDSIDGISAAGLAKGEKTDWREYIHGEHIVRHHSIQFLTDGKEKYIWFTENGHEQLFNLENDPQEKTDLASVPNGEKRLKIWRDRLIKELSGREEGYSDGEKLIPAKKGNAVLSHYLKKSGLEK